MKKNDLTLGGVGEWGFLHRLLPRLKKRAGSAFLVSPGDDAAVLRGGERPVLSIDGLTEGTHFRSRWNVRVQKLLGVPLGRALAWKWLGSSLSDLAAMGATDRRWAMTYLGAPGSLPLAFLQELYRGCDEAARRFDCALAGGDTVRARDITLVAAVGARLKSRPLTRHGGRPGMAICVTGDVGDAAAGLLVLDGRKSLPAPDARFFVRRFFDVRPEFEMGARLARERGVGGAMDVSDALSDCLSIFCRDSGVKADVHLDAIPRSAAFRRHFDARFALAGGEDYALLFAAEPATALRLARRGGATIIGRMTGRGAGITYFEKGKAVRPPAAFQHFA